MKYDDIIDLPHFHDPTRGYMSNQDRSAQFMPFKSLKGYEDMVDDKNQKILDAEWERIIYEDEDPYSGHDPDRILDDGDDVSTNAGK